MCLDFVLKYSSYVRIECYKCQNDGNTSQYFFIRHDTYYLSALVGNQFVRSNGELSRAAAASLVKKMRFGVGLSDFRFHNLFAYNFKFTFIYDYYLRITNRAQLYFF